MKKLIKTTIAVWITLLTTGGAAQMLTPKWETCLGGTDWDEGTGMIMIDSTYWVIGNTSSTNGDISYNHGSFDYWFLKVNIEGNMVNEKTFGGTNAEEGNTDIKILNDSVFYIAGTSNSTDGDISYNPWPGNGNLWILQVNNKWEMLWEEMAGGTGKDYISDFIVTDDGGVLVLSMCTSHDGDISDHHGGWDLWMIKIDNNGQKQWDLSLGGTGFEGGGSVKQTSDGGYIVGGYTDGSGGGNYDSTCNFHGIPGGGFPDAWIVKLDSARNIQWQQCYGGTYPDACSNIIELADGYLVLGHTMSNDGDVSGYHSIPGPNSKYGGDIWVFKIDKTGHLLWQKCLGGTYNDFARNIFTTGDGGYMIVGTTASKDGDVVGNHDLIAGWTGDIWFVKIDSTGNLLWQYCYGDIAQESIYRGVVQKSDWDYVVTIGTTSRDWQCYYSAYPDVRVVELYDSTVGINEQAVLPVKVKVYPNPANSTLHIELPDNTTAKTATVEMLDISGRRVLKETFKAPAIQLNTSGLKSGLYLVKVQTGKGVATEKVVIR